MLAKADPSRAAPRVTTMIRATMRDGRGAHEIAILDLSVRGVLATCGKPPERGDFVDLNINRQVIAGQVKWVRGQRFGIALRERIDVAAVLEGRAPVRQAKPAPVQEPPALDSSPKMLLIAYTVMGLAATSAAWLIVTFVL